MAAMRLGVAMIWVMAAMGIAQTPADAPDPYSGTFRREQVVLQLTPYADGLILTAEGLTYRLERSSKSDLH
jgi:hypothetical protein